MSIPITKPDLAEEEAKAAHDTVLSGWVTQGPRVEEFERHFAAYVGAEHAVAVSSCTTALHLSLVVAGVETGDEVICPSMSFIATANCISYVGATPVFAEVNPTTYNIDPAHAEKCITSRTKAILIVHQMGMPAEIAPFQTLCAKYNLQLIEDAAAAAGSSYREKNIGSHSDLVCFSFHPRKIITTGEGGMITTSNRAYTDRLRLLRHHGMSVNDRVRHLAKSVIIEEYLEVGYNYRMTDIQASIGIEQLKRIDCIVAARRNVASRYNEAFGNISCVRIPHEPAQCRSNYQSYPLYLKSTCPLSRNELMQKLLDRGIATRQGIVTSHREPAYRQAYRNLRLPLSEDAADRSLLLPIFSGIREEEILYVIATLTELFS